jgi:AbrB family looped-hinge helix DNA binding protein
MMLKKEKDKSLGLKKFKALSCCRVESITSVDERGQMVLPKEIRERAEIGAGDKLVLISWEKEGKVCCISLIKSEDFEKMVKGFLSPMMKDLIRI